MQWSDFYRFESLTAFATLQTILNAVKAILFKHHQSNVKKGLTMSKIFTLLVASFLAACTTVAPSQGYRSAGSTAAPWQIRGELFDITNVKIYINDTKVIDDRISLMSGDGEFRSRYDGESISASCSATSGLLTVSTKCIIFVENERAATLSF
jgi:hypothetical protein